MAASNSRAVLSSQAVTTRRSVRAELGIIDRSVLEPDLRALDRIPQDRPDSPAVHLFPPRVRLVEGEHFGEEEQSTSRIPLVEQSRANAQVQPHQVLTTLLGLFLRAWRCRLPWPP